MAARSETIAMRDGEKIAAGALQRIPAPAKSTARDAA